MKKTVSVLLAFCMLAGLLPVSAAEYTYTEPVEKDKWKDPEFSTDHAYSIAFVGDPQFINNSDVNFGEKKMEQMFGIIADTAELRKLKHVFVLGDITHVGYRNDSNLAARHVTPPDTREWENAQKSILQLSRAGISYSLCRGNHDDYMMDDYFNIPAYTDQFKGCGGFFSDSGARYSGGREPLNPDQSIYWSAISGYHENSIVNSYKTMEICGNKYIFITVDFNPTMKVVNWLNDTLEEYSDHLAIVTTHAYINKLGQHLPENDGTMIDHGIAAPQLWDSCLKLHENLLMVVCGHVSCIRPLVSARKGENGNTVREILVNPQGYDLNREVGRGTQDTGAVLYMNFSENGGKVTFDYYSTLMNQEYADENYPMNLYKENPLKQVDQETSAETEQVTETTPTTTTPGNTQPPLQGQKSGTVIAVAIGSVAAVAGIAFGIVFIGKKKKK